MEHSLQDSAKINAAYAHESAQGIRISPGPYVGIVKSNTDPLRSGKLQVWIPELGGDPDDHSSWRTVSYVTPFYGVTDIRDDSGYKGDPHSYGMWFVPPDLGVKVLCTFANGNPFNGFWFGCIPEWPSLHMVPGLSGPMSGNPPSPVTDFYDNKSNPGDLQDFTNHKRNVHQYQEAIWDKQGILKDPDRGPGTSSAFRETPSNVFGISTPGQPLDTPTEGAANGEGTSSIGVKGRKGGHTFIMDDGDAQGKNAMMRFRTSGGHMIMMNDTKDFIYVINSKGTSWVEINSQGDMNVYSGSKVNVFAQSEINLETKGALKLHGATVDILSDGAFNIQGKDINVLADGSTKVTGKSSLHLKGKNTYLTGDSCIQIKADGHIDLKGSCHTINTADATKATEAGKATAPSNMPSKEKFTGRVSPPNQQAQQPYGSQQGLPTGAAGAYGAASNFGSGGAQSNYGPMTNNIPPITYTNNPPGFQGQGSPVGNYAPTNYIASGISYAAANIVQNITYGGGAYFDVTNLSSDNNSSPDFSAGELQNNPGNLQYVSGDAYAVGFAHNLAVYARPEQGIAALITLFDKFAADPSTICIQLLQQYLKATTAQDPRVLDMARYIQNNLGIGPNDYVALKDPTTRIGWVANVIKYVQKHIIYTYDQIASGCALSLNVDTVTFLHGAQPITQPWQNSGGTNPYTGFVNPATNSGITNNGNSPLQNIGNQIINRVLNNVVGTVAADIGASVGNSIRQTVSDPAYNANSSGVNLGLAAGGTAYTSYLGQSVGSGQCVALTQAASNVGQTSTWVPGTSVTTGTLPPGTVIATFGSDGTYQNIPGQSHAAILLDYQKDSSGNITGIVVQDQWAGQACGVRTIPFGKGTAESGENFVAVTHDGSTAIQANGSPQTITQQDVATLNGEPVPLPPERPASLDAVATTDSRNMLDPAQRAELNQQNIATTPTYGMMDPAQRAELAQQSMAQDANNGTLDPAQRAELASQSQTYQYNAGTGNPAPSDGTAVDPRGTSQVAPITTEYSPPTPVYNSVPGMQRVYDANSGQYTYQAKDDAGNTIVVQDSTVQSLYAQGQTPSSLGEIGPSGIKSIEDSGTLQTAASDTTPNRDTPIDSSYLYNNQPPQSTNTVTSPDTTLGYLNPDHPTGQTSGFNQGSTTNSINADPRQGEGTLAGGYNDPAVSATPVAATPAVTTDPRTGEVVNADQSQPTPITADPRGTSQIPGAGSAAPGGGAKTPQGSAATNGAGKSC